MNATGVLIALDILNASLKTAAQVQELMLKAQIENRDVTDQEIAGLINDNDAKLKVFKDNIS